jgi:proteasome lid subunit RPN8/RPN11
MQTNSRHLRELKLTYVVRHDTHGQPLTLGDIVTEPAGAATILRSLLQHEPVEVFAILMLSTKHQVIGYHEVSRGTLDSSLVHPREVFKAAILANASAIVLAHNHPSGNPTPSPEDHQVTQRLTRAGEDDPFTDEQLEFLLDLLKNPDLDEPDAELVLTVLKSRDEDVLEHLTDILERFPSLSRIYSFCQHVSDLTQLTALLNKGS